MYFRVIKKLIKMNRNTQLILAGSFGMAIVFGIIAVRSFFKNKEYEIEYGDFHRNFG